MDSPHEVPKACVRVELYTQVAYYQFKKVVLDPVFNNSILLRMNQLDVCGGMVCWLMLP